MTHYLEHDHSDDDIDRRGFLRCMAWAGTGVVFTLTASGVTTNQLGSTSAAAAMNSFSFVQISDSHVGFDTAPNKDVIGTLERAVKKINALPQRPSFVVHTGDHVHLSTPASSTRSSRSSGPSGPARCSTSRASTTYSSMAVVAI